VGTAVVYLVVMVAVAAVVFLAVALLFGRGEELAPLAPGTSPTRLPAKAIGAQDVRELRFQQVVRGYKMSEVDWALDRLAAELDRAHRDLDRMRSRLTELEAGRPVLPRLQSQPLARPVSEAEPEQPASADPKEAG
jgi:DivIVA domain-containing protein